MYMFRAAWRAQSDTGRSMPVVRTIRVRADRVRFPAPRQIIKQVLTRLFCYLRRESRDPWQATGVIPCSPTNNKTGVNAPVLLFAQGIAGPVAGHGSHSSSRRSFN
jgi:hypothetical protein